MCIDLTNCGVDILGSKHNNGDVVLTRHTVLQVDTAQGQCPMAGGREMLYSQHPTDTLHYLANGHDTRPEIQNLLRDDLHLTYEQGERGFVREQIKRQSGKFLDDPQIITKTMTIAAQNILQVIRQTTSPEVKTLKTMTISSVGSKQPVSKDNIQITQMSKQEDMSSYQLPGISNYGQISFISPNNPPLY